MKPPVFAYERASSIGDAVRLLAEAGDDAKLIAGGQSLVAMMNLRLVRPSLLVDIGGLPGLRYLRSDGEALHVGALTTHEQLETYPTILPGFDVLRRTAPLVGHRPIRTRGTIGGSIAHADAAAEWCLLARLLDATVVATSVRGTRLLAADGFFQGLFTTTLAPDEVVTELRFPRPRPHAALQEFSRRHGDFAIVAVAVTFDVVGGRIDDPRVVLGGVGGHPLRSPAAEAARAGQTPSAAVFDDAGAAAAAAIDPPADLHATPSVRRRLVTTLLRRAADEALAGEREVHRV